MQITDHEQATLNTLEMFIRNGLNLKAAAQRLLDMGLDPSHVSRVADIRSELAEKRRFLAQDRALSDLEDAPRAWYTGPSEDDVFWPSLKELMQDDPKWAPAVDSLDSSSTDIVSLLADPHSPEIRTRGLVVGHVQSGKTANFTATIAKAADAGYRLFIVLSGVHNALRKQTQQRLDSQLYELQKTHWVQLTDEDRDFGNPVRALALLAGSELKIYAVVKKNVSRLTRLRDWLREAHSQGGLNTCPVLIIDDESDQASPNAATNAELNQTKINMRITELLEMPRVAYVGYTATPFANVLINPADANDLYPRDFIFALEKPESYFGATELFGDSVIEEEETQDSSPRDMIRFVPQDEATHYSAKASRNFEPIIVASLQEAIRWFILATAARRVRSGQTAHSSMLIHTTMRVAPQLQMVPAIKDFVRRLSRSWSVGDIDLWRSQWEEEQRLEPPSRSGHSPIDFSSLIDAIGEVLHETTVVADNSHSTERLIYSDEPATVIAVGGNTLSRGLTLEGLICSYFLRSSSTYDSLLQMGRWFGYRPGYEDLPRIWTTEDLAEDFRFLSIVEAEIRSEIARYSQENAKPIELPVRIRTHPRMQVTAKNKMQFAVPGQASYSASRPQTTYFHHKDIDIISSNWDAARLLINSAVDLGGVMDQQGNRVIVKDVPADEIDDFVSRFTFHEDTELRSDLLHTYMEEQRSLGRLETWNIAIMSRQGEGAEVDLGLPEDTKVRTITRSRLKKPVSEVTANIGVLMSKPDRVADLIDASVAARKDPAELLKLRDESGRALLLLYPIDKDSKPKPSAEHWRKELQAKDHLLGVAFSFPNAHPQSAISSTVQVDPALLFTAAADDDLESYTDTEGSRDEVDLDA